MYKMKNGKDVSEETVDLALQAHFKANQPGLKLPEKQKFEPISIHDGCFVVSVDYSDYTVRIKTNKDFSGPHSCYQCISTVDEFIDALQKAKAFAIANNK